MDGLDNGIDFFLWYCFGGVHSLGCIAPVQMFTRCLYYYVFILIISVLRLGYVFVTNDVIRTDRGHKKAYF